MPAGPRFPARSTGFPGKRSADRHEQHIARGPAERLDARREGGLEQEGIAQQRQHRREVREGEQPVGTRARIGAREPRLRQRAGGRKQHVRQADGGEQQQQDAQGRVFEPRGLPRRRGNDRQECEAQHQQRYMDRRLPPRREAARQPVRIGIAEQQDELEEDHAHGPDRGGSPEPGQDLLGQHRLDEEQEKRADEDRGGIERHSLGILGDRKGKSAANVSR